MEGLLERVERPLRGRQALDGRELGAVGLHGVGDAGAHGGPVPQDRAGTADAVLAAEVRAGKTQVVAEEVGERPPRLDLALVDDAVHGHPDAVAAHAVAFRSARCTSTRTSRRR